MNIRRTLTVVAAGLFAGILGAGSIAAAADAPFRMQTFEKLPGDFATSHGYSWPDLARYIDYLDTDQRAVNAAHDSGIKVGFYTDVHLLCKGSECSGNPGVDGLPEAAFAHDCAGRRVFTSDTNPGAHKLLGDPNSPALERVFNNVITNMLSNQYGSYRYDFVFDDDVFIPNEPWYGWHGASPTGPRLEKPYCGYSDASYVGGIKKMMANARLPIIFNGLNARKDISYVQRQPNVLGGMCEDCLHASYDPKRDHEASPIWNQQIDAALAAAARDKLWIAYPHGKISDDTQGYIYASLMLVYAQKSTTLHEDIETPSGLTLPPTILLVPTSPVRGAALHNGDLRQPGGAYAREFRACYIAGLAVGRCAAIVNPDANASVPNPFPEGRYRHTLTIRGRGVARELGDDGSISAQGPAPARTIAPRGWQIVFE